MRSSNHPATVYLSSQLEAISVKFCMTFLGYYNYVGCTICNPSLVGPLFFL